MIRVVAIDDHPLILKIITQEINDAGDMQIVGTANHGSKLHALVRETSPDVVILDLGMSTGVFEPVSAVRQLVTDHPGTKVLILTGNDSATFIRDLIKAGAMGYLLKFEDLSLELANAVRTIYNGVYFYSTATTNILLTDEAKPTIDLTDRELHVLRLVAKGYQNERIGELVGISGQWVRNLLTDIYEKMDIPSDVNSRVVAVNKARELDLLGE